MIQKLLLPVLLTGGLICSSCVSDAQRIVHFDEARNGKIHLTDQLVINEETAGYTIVLPESGKVKGMIVFFNSDRDTINKIYRYANPEQLAVLYVTSGHPFEFFFEEDKMQQVENYIHHAITHYEVPEGNLLYTGMSLSGTRALKMAVYSQSEHSNHHLKPRAVAVCDAPLDFVRFWRECKKAEQIAFHPAAAQEGTWVSAYLEKNLGGRPADKMQEYIQYSPYCYIDDQGGNLGYLKDIAVRAYTEPDVQWWMETRRKDYYGMNAVDAAGLINELRILGNEEAELITTTDKGYFPDGRRHPHSWSIVDEKELVEWFLSKL